MSYTLSVILLPTDPNSRLEEAILVQVDTFNYIWLIGLFFFGIHLTLLSKIALVPKFIKGMLALAGVMYVVDTVAHFSLSNYADFASVFLVLVATPSIIGEMSFALWLLIKGGKPVHNKTAG